ncbi:uL22 family ribosomal protein [Candidatus Hodgkinia cicadicola]
MLVYSLSLIRYSPKKLSQMAGQLKGEIHNILSFLRYSDRVKIRTILSKFFLHVLNDVAGKFGKQKRVFISECYIGRADIIRRTRYAAKGKITHRKLRKVNLKANVLLI